MTLTKEEFGENVEYLAKNVSGAVLEKLYSDNCWRMDFLDIKAILFDGKAKFIVDLSNIHCFKETGLNKSLLKAMLALTEHNMEGILWALEKAYGDKKNKEKLVYVVEKTGTGEKTGFHIPILTLSLDFYHGRLMRGTISDANMMNIQHGAVTPRIGNVGVLSTIYSALWEARTVLIDYIQAEGEK